ncbi:MAG: DUF459 domain-containing protein [Acidimicrobiales bacterium]|nr:DUF459 domain-containing protein [Acidimicrobiales bacterium]
MVTIERLRRRNPGAKAEATRPESYEESLKRAVSRKRRSTIAWTDEHFRRQRDDDLAPLLVTWRQALVAVFVALFVALALSTSRLVDIATQMPLGDRRDVALDVATALDDAASAIGLDRPAAWIEELRGGNDAGRTNDRIDSSIIGESLLPASTLDPADLAIAPPATPTDPNNPSVPVTTALPSSVADVTVEDETVEEPGPETVTESGPTTVPPAEAESALRLVTEEQPLRIFVGGDSQAEFLNYGLIDRSGGLGLPSEVDARWQISTGLARPDVFNWPAELAAVIEADDPEAVVLFLGANDSQDMATDAGVAKDGSPEWEAEYRRRLEITMDLLRAPHRRVFWVAQPPMQDGELNQDLQPVNAVAESIAAERDWVIWIDAYAQFGGDDGFSTYLPDAEGNEVKVRAGDGVHLSQDGANWLAESVIAAMLDTWPTS